MSGNRRNILEMLSEGKITAEEAERLLDAPAKEPALAEASPDAGGSPRSGAMPKYLRILVDDTKDPTKVNIRIPFQLLRAGVKLASLLPTGARDRVNKVLDEKGTGFNLNQLTAENADEFIQAFTEMTIDVDADGGLTKVKVFCE